MADITSLEEVLEDTPKADVVEVVRCKDCKHRHIPTRCALWYGTVDNKEYFVERGDNFSCLYGERRDNNGKTTQSLEHWLWVNHRDIIGLILLGHIELFIEEMKREYIEWCKTDEGKQYLKGGCKYREE